MDIQDITERPSEAENTTPSEAENTTPTERPSEAENTTPSEAENTTPTERPSEAENTTPSEAENTTPTERPSEAPTEMERVSEGGNTASEGGNLAATEIEETPSEGGITERASGGNTASEGGNLAATEIEETPSEGGITERASGGNTASEGGNLAATEIEETPSEGGITERASGGNTASEGGNLAATEIEETPSEGGITERASGGNTEPIELESGAPLIESDHSQRRKDYFNPHTALHKAALKGDWETAQSLLPTIDIKAPVENGGQTALHVAALEGHTDFVSKLLALLDDHEILIRAKNGNTALNYAIYGKTLAIAKLLIERNANIGKLKNAAGYLPIYTAAENDYKEITDYLFPSCGFDTWDTEDQMSFLAVLLEHKFYGLALKIVKKHKSLAVAETRNGETALQVLARKPSVFPRSSGGGVGGYIVHSILLKMKLKRASIDEASEPEKLVDYLWMNAMDPNDAEMREITSISRSAFEAAQYGNEEFLVNLINKYPGFLYLVNNSLHTIFHVAIMHRQVKIFNLILDLKALKDLLASHIDQEGNNMLHLAGLLGPETQETCIAGAALQMQREVLWFKKIESLSPPAQRNLKNTAGDTPYEIFSKNHQELRKTAEKQMKQLAHSCMLVAILIATLAFTVTFAVPGGYNSSTGAPVLKNKPLFLVFPVSEGAATLFSLTSILLFLWMLTSNYSDQYFVKILPLSLVMGLSSLFLAIVSMMGLFCMCILYFREWSPIIISVVVVFALVPVISLMLTYPIVAPVVSCTCSSGWLFRPPNRLKL